MKKAPVKKLLVVIGRDEDKKTILEQVAPFVTQSMALQDTVLPGLKEALGKKIPDSLTSTQHHCRHFFAKIGRGPRAVQNYEGKVLNTKEEVVDFFINYVGGRAFGPDWLLEELLTFFKFKKEGLFLVTDLTLEQARKLKPALNSSLAIVFAGEGAPPKNADYALAPQPTKGAMKRMTNTLIDKLTNKPEKKESIHERTKSEL